MKWFLSILISLLVTSTVTAQQTLFSEDFESPVVSGYSEATPVPTGWVRANNGFGASRCGLLNKDGGDFFPVSGNQAYVFRYTNSGLGTDVGQIGALNVNDVTYTLTFDVYADGAVTDPYTPGVTGTAYRVDFVVYTNGATRDNYASTSENWSTILASTNGNVVADTNKTSFSIAYTTDPYVDADIDGLDIAVRLDGETAGAIIDNVRVTITYPASQWMVVGTSLVRIGTGGVLKRPWTPAQIETVAWYDAATVDTLTIGSGQVSQWDDKSGNGNDAVQTTGSQQPTYNTSDSIMNDLPSIGYDQDNGEVGLTTPTFTSKNVYIVAYYSDGVTNLFASGPNFPAIISGPTPEGGAVRVVGDSGQSQFRSSGGREWYATGGTIRFNGGSPQPPSASVLPMPPTILFFSSVTDVTQATDIGHNDISGTVYQWNGAYSEVIFTDGSENTATRQKIEGYLAWKWGLEADLPSDHPYKNQRP